MSNYELIEKLKKQILEIDQELAVLNKDMKQPYYSVDQIRIWRKRKRNLLKEQGKYYSLIKELRKK